MTSEYTLTGACGGGIMLAYPKESEPLVFDFFVNTPKTRSVKNLDFFRLAVDFGPASQFFHIGKGSVAVPGNTIGLLHIHSTYHHCIQNNMGLIQSLVSSLFGP